MNPFLSLAGITKRFGEVRVLERVGLEVVEGETVALLGPSGSGKTTLLRILAGFERPDAGTIELAGRDVTALAPAARRFGMVFQHYALFPHLDVGENVAFGLRGTPLAARERERVGEVLELVDLAGYEGRHVSQLSGGQQQRVALARALAPEPRVLLLDEPLSNLDPALRERTRRQLRETIDRVGITTLFVTHEQEEAFDLGGRVAVLFSGRLEQVGPPEELYRRPLTPFVAGFVGRSSRLAGVLAAAGRVRLERGDGAGPVAWPAEAVGEPGEGERVEVIARPESLRLVSPGDPAALPGRVRARRYTGPLTYFTVDLARGGEVEVLAAHDAAVEDEAVGVAVGGPGPELRAFPAAGGEGTPG